MPHYNAPNPQPEQNNLPTLYQEQGTVMNELLGSGGAFLAEATIQDLMTEGIDNSGYTLHNLFTAGTASTLDEPIQVMMYAQRREPLPHQVGSDINFWVSYNIEAFNSRTRDHIGYTYRPKEYTSSPIPEEVGARKRLNAQEAASFQRGLTFWLTTVRENALTRDDVAELRYYLSTAQYDEALTQKMVDHHLMKWPKSYRPGEKPQDPGWKKGLQWLSKKILDS